MPAFRLVVIGPSDCPDIEDRNHCRGPTVTFKNSSQVISTSSCPNMPAARKARFGITVPPEALAAESASRSEPGGFELTGSHRLYSTRNATIGSIREALRAGK